MIICIRLKNFYSLRDDSALDFTADMSSRNSQNNLPENLLDFKGDKFVNIIGLFGSNAAGKSNIIKALDSCRNLILTSHLKNEGSSIDFEPFKFDEERPSEFYIDFVANGIEYEYSFSLIRDKILTESLYYYPNGRKAKIFSREGNQYTYGKGMIPRPSEIEANTGEKTLFLSRASSMNRQAAQIVYRFFLNDIVIGVSNLEFSLHSIKEFEINKDLILRAFEVSDSDIIDIRIVESAPGQFKLQSFHREDPTIPFDFEKEESEGTKRLLLLLLLIVKNALTGATIFIDEFDLKLHLRLSEFILDVIRASHSGQLVFTSHNPNLINQEKLRPEQIVFVNKQQDGNSQFVPLSDYEGINVKTDIQKAYLQGRFDAVPYIGNPCDILENLMQKK